MSSLRLTDKAFKTLALAAASSVEPSAASAYVAYAWFGLASGILQSTRSNPGKNRGNQERRLARTFKRRHRRALIEAMFLALSEASRDPRIDALREKIQDPSLWLKLGDAEVAAYGAYLNWFERVLSHGRSTIRMSDDLHARQLWERWQRLHQEMIVKKLGEAAELLGFAFVLHEEPS
jgi:hypothetical protein